MSAPEFEAITNIMESMSKDLEHVNESYYRRQIRGELETLRYYVDNLEQSQAVLSARIASYSQPKKS